MEANAPPLSGGDSPSPAPGTGELVVQNGRHAGTRRPLASPLTLLGRAAGCDIRLNVESVHPQHCAIFQVAGRLILRDLGSTTGTFVNDQRVTTCLLCDGDSLTVGPFQFRVRWDENLTEGTGAEPVSRPGERDAVRVQAAAVAAQQAALLDEELRLQQRRTALEKQEEQLAAHLEERRLSLVSVQEEVRQERTLLDQERAAFEQERRTRLEETARNRDEAALTLKQAQNERGRLLLFRRRLRQRWRRHWDAQEKGLLCRHREVTKECDRLRADQLALSRTKLQFNGEVELGRRQLADARDELLKAQREWQALRQREEAELSRQRRELRAGREALAAAREALAAREQQTEATRVTLEREAAGVESRIRNLRLKLVEFEAERERLRGQSDTHPAPSTLAVASPTATISRETLDAGDSGLHALAAVLADQRLHLAEQWERFVRAQRAWHEEQSALLPQFEETAQRLAEREHRLVEEERERATATEDLRVRQRTLSQLRSELEAWQARLAANESSWRAERTSLLARVATRETLAERRQVLLETLRKRWTARRKEEAELLAREMKRCRESLHRYAELREDFEQRSAGLASRERTLAERTLALEQYQLELVGRSDNSVAAEKRLQKLQRQLTAQHADAERRLAERRQTLEEEAERLRARDHHLHQRVETLVARETGLSSKQTEWEHHRLNVEQSREQQQQELLRLREQGEAASRHNKELQEVLEGVIRALLEEAETLPPSIRAA